MCFKRRCGSTMLMLVICLFLYKPVEANTFNFAVEIEKPTNQIDMKKGYFDLLVSPGQTQQLKVKLTNTTNKAVSIHPQIASATTNNSGVVEYSPNNKKRDASMSADVTQWLSVPRKITIAADSTYLLPIDVVVPDSTFKGSIVAGLTLTENKPETNTTKGASGMAIDNRYAYVVGLELRQSTKKLVPQLELKQVFASQRNYRNIIAATIQNRTSTYVNQLQIDAKVTRKGKKKPLYQSHTVMMQMAPNSNFDYPIALGEGERLQAGDYTLHMTASSFKNKWQWQKEFTITNTKANAYNEADVTVQKRPVWFYAISVMLMLLCISLWFYIRKKRQQKRGGNNDDK